MITLCGAQVISQSPFAKISVKLEATLPFKALSDETRYRIYRLLLSAMSPLSVGQIAEAMAMPANNLSRHLQILEGAGLICLVRRGRMHYCWVPSESQPLGLVAKAAVAMGDETGIHALDYSRLTIVTSDEPSEENDSVRFRNR